MMRIIYNKIGKGYDVTRKADPEITHTIIELLEIKKKGTYLDVACGTGNYTSKFCMAGGIWTAFDSSEIMLAEARKKSDLVKWKKFEVESMDLKSETFNGATCVLAIHHFSDLNKAFGELSRILKHGGCFVIFTSTPEQMKGYWLHHYFPRMMEKASEQMPSIKDVTGALSCAGMELVEVHLFL